MSMKMRNNLIAYSFILPNFIGFAIFTLIPIIISMGLSVMDWDGLSEPVFVGLLNFQKLFANSTFRISLKNTIIYTVETVPFTVVASLALAMALNKGFKFTNTFRTVFFLPYVGSLIAIAVVWNMLFQPEIGPVNFFLRLIGIVNPPKWTSSATWALPAVVIVSIWRNAGYYMVLYLAGLQGIPGELYEAGLIDGTNGWQKFRHITLPLLTPTTFYVLIMLTISCFKVFDLVYVMTEGGPGRATNVLVLTIYNEAFKNTRFGYSSAVSMVLFAIVLVITIVQFQMQKKWVNYM